MGWWAAFEDTLWNYNLYEYVCGPVKWYGWSVVQDLQDLIFKKHYSSWLVGWWAAFEDTPLDLQFVGEYCVGQLSGMVGQLSRIYMT